MTLKVIAEDMPLCKDIKVIPLTPGFQGFIAPGTASMLTVRMHLVANPRKVARMKFHERQGR